MPLLDPTLPRTWHAWGMAERPKQPWISVSLLGSSSISRQGSGETTHSKGRESHLTKVRRAAGIKDGDARKLSGRAAEPSCQAGCGVEVAQEKARGQTDFYM